MKMKFFILAAAILSTTVFANESEVTLNYQVPFYNVEIQPNNTIQASYNFDPSYQTLVCTMRSLVSLSLKWQYKGSQYVAGIPVGGHLSLKGYTYPEGYFINSKGLITIAHNKPTTEKAVISCEYHTWA